MTLLIYLRQRRFDSAAGDAGDASAADAAAAVMAVITSRCLSNPTAYLRSMCRRIDSPCFFARPRGAAYRRLSVSDRRQLAARRADC